tara:strand:- start:74 stop:877 length:804 start_codon:yes stop_codon:yes gene_type:complete
MIHLFGDSFVYADDANELGLKDYTRWYDIIETQCNENTTNYGRNGDGCISTMELFTSLYERKWFEENDKIVVVLSSPYRIPWDWDLKVDGTLGDPSSWYDMWSERKRKYDLEDKYKFSMNSLYDCMSEELARLNLKNICLLKHITDITNISICVFTVFNKTQSNTEKQYDESVYDLNKLNSSKFYLHPTPLYEISEKEWEHKEEYNAGLINHLSESNHQILANIITNHFIGTSYDETFHTSFITGRKNKDAQYATVKNNRFCEFLYE